MLSRMLVLCASCRRHIQRSEAACPFCGGGRTIPRDPSEPTRRLDRLAIMTFATSVYACGGGGGASTTATAPLPSGTPAPSTTAPSTTTPSSAAPSASVAPSTLASMAADPFPASPGPDTAAPMYGAPPQPTLGPGSMVGAYGAPPGPGLGGVTKPPPGNLTLGTAVGSADDLKLLRTRTGALRDCFEKDAASLPDPSTCRLAVAIDATGAPTPTVTCKVGPPSLGVCLTGRLKLVKFVAGDARSLAVDVTFSTKK